MIPESVGPDRLGAVYEALAQWRMFARAARLDAQADQRTLSLDLLHTARHLAAGIDALSRLEQQQRHHTAILDNLRAVAVHTGERLAHRAASVRVLLDAAERTARDPARTPRQQSTAALVEAQAHAQVARLETAASAARRASAETVRLLERHTRIERELHDLRIEFTALRTLVERGLAVMTSAGRLLNEAAEVYEGAQMSATDLRRELIVDEPVRALDPFEFSLSASA